MILSLTLAGRGLCMCFAFGSFVPGLGREVSASLSFMLILAFIAPRRQESG